VTSPGLSDICRDMHFRRAFIDKGTQLTAIIRGPEGNPQFHLAIIGSRSVGIVRSQTKATEFSLVYLNNRSTWDIGVLGYIGIV